MPDSRCSCSSASTTSVARRSAPRRSRARAPGSRGTPTWSRCCPRASPATSTSASSCGHARSASYSPTIRDGRHVGLLVEHDEGTATRESFRTLTGSDVEYDAWQRLLRRRRGRRGPDRADPDRTTRDRTGDGDRRRPELWSALVERPIGEVIEQRFTDDLACGRRGDRCTDRHLRDTHDPSLVQNRCFLYHLIGNGTGEWRVPVRGMGAVTERLARAAAAAGAEILTAAGVSAIAPTTTGAEVTWHDGDASTTACAPHGAGQRRALGAADPARRGARGGDQAGGLAAEDQLPALPTAAAQVRRRPGRSVRRARFHVAEEYAALETAYRQAAAGEIPDEPPGELYCHSLTDPSILGELADYGAHALTYFGLHLPEALFDHRHRGPQAEAVRRAIAAIDVHLMEPLLSLRDDRAGRVAVRRGEVPAGRRGRPRDARRPHLPRRPGLALGQRTGRRSTPRPSSGASPPIWARCCCADRAPDGAERSADWAVTTRRRPCSPAAEETALPRFRILRGRW